jgi:2-haloacid dehalogenase
MALPKTVEWVTFDVYGTLIDWESGIWAAFKKEAARDGFPLEEHVNKDKLIDLFHLTAQDVEGGSYEMYAEVLRQTAVKIAKEIEWPLEPSRSGFLPDSVASWKPFRETGPQIRKVLASKTVQSGLIANMDDKLLGITRRANSLKWAGSGL